MLNVSLGVIPVQISIQLIFQCNSNGLSDLCDTGKTLFYAGDNAPKPWLFTLIWQTMCVFINLGYVCFIILFYGLNTGYS